MGSQLAAGACRLCSSATICASAGKQGQSPDTLLQVKNVGSDEVEGKVGRIYMPAQDVGSMALHKMKVGFSGLLPVEVSPNSQYHTC